MGNDVASPAHGTARREDVVGQVVRYRRRRRPMGRCVQVPVRLAGQDDWTYLSVPTGHPGRSAARAAYASLTVGPGETATFDLTQMTTWQLREDWGGIEYAVAHAGPAFTVSQEGSTVTITGADRAVPGAEEVAVVSVTSHPAVASARLILRVGAAPSALPRGGSVPQQCSQAAGSSCAITVVGATGEVNPLPRTPLEVIDVRGTGACAEVRSRAPRHRPSRLVDGGCARGDVHRRLLGAGRPGPPHQRRSRRPAAPRPAGVPEGAGERRRRPAYATAPSRSASTRARRAWRTRRSPASSSAPAAASSRSAARTAPAPRSAPRTASSAPTRPSPSTPSASRARASGRARGRTTRRRRRVRSRPHRS